VAPALELTDRQKNKTDFKVFIYSLLEATQYTRKASEMKKLAFKILGLIYFCLRNRKILSTISWRGDGKCSQLFRICLIMKLPLLVFNINPDFRDLMSHIG
jgi:hypothetical protein